MRSTIPAILPSVL